MKNFVNDLSIIMKVPPRTVRRIIKNAMALVCHYVAESSVEQSPETQIDTGFGTLTIKIMDKQITSSFQFNEQSEKLLKGSASKNISMLEDMVDEEISNRIHDKFKELL